jgi:SagB-type dehydrogenase family enzyme
MNVDSASAAVLAYHERSKHRLDRYAPGPGYLDWVSQPDPFRTYAGAPRVALPLLADELATSFRSIRTGVLPAASPFTRDTLAVLFELSFAISAWKSYGGNTWALRCNPSSGNLHPTEAYLVCGEMPGVQAGGYHYVSRDHAFEQRAALGDALPARGDGVMIGIASIYWREAWKYGMRAFRYCQHDSGHAIAAVSYAAAALGWETRLLDSVGDAHIDALLGLGEGIGDAEREQPDCLLWVGPGTAPPIEPLLAALSSVGWSGRANRLSAKHVEWPDIDAVHAATIKPPTQACDRIAGVAHDASLQPQLDLPAATLIRQRRSAVDFDGVTSIGAEAFYAMLEAVQPNASVPPWNAWRTPAQVHLALFVHRVDGLEPGLYVCLRDAGAKQPLREALRPEWLWHPVGPPRLQLYLLLPHDLRDAARIVCCHQDIAADSCFSLGMLASFGQIQSMPWRYRALYWECGMVGQTLYLEAEAAGVRATGIGCFFDDEMHRLLGLEGNAWQSLYHFTVGGAVEDRRLTTLPAYPNRTLR